MKTVILLLLATASSSVAIDLSPEEATYKVEGAQFKQIAFRGDTDKKITYSPPPHWTYSGTSNQLTLRPPGKAQAVATITALPLSAPETFDADTMKKLTDEFVASVPPESTNVTLVDQQKNPLMIERKETFLVVITYTVYGQDYERSIMYLNRDREQIRFELVARASDFKPLQQAFLASHFSWQNL